jgi:hypothetical protein
MRLCFAQWRSGTRAVALSFVTTLACASAASACTAGAGPSATEASFAREDTPSFLRDDPGTSRDDPGAAGDHSGSACLACDRNYECRGVVSGRTFDAVVHLTSSQGDCGSKGSLFACDGTVRDHGKVSATWTAIRGGGFRVCDQGVCIDCVPTDEPVTPQPQPPPGQGNGGGGSVDASSNGGD